MAKKMIVALLDTEPSSGLEALTPDGAAAIAANASGKSANAANVIRDPLTGKVLFVEVNLPVDTAASDFEKAIEALNNTKGKSCIVSAMPLDLLGDSYDSFEGLVKLSDASLLQEGDMVDFIGGRLKLSSSFGPPRYDLTRAATGIASIVIDSEQDTPQGTASALTMFTESLIPPVIYTPPRDVTTLWDAMTFGVKVRFETPKDIREGQPGMPLVDPVAFEIDKTCFRFGAFFVEIDLGNNGYPLSFFQDTYFPAATSPQNRVRFILGGQPDYSCGGIGPILPWSSVQQFDAVIPWDEWVTITGSYSRTGDRASLSISSPTIGLETKTYVPSIDFPQVDLVVGGAANSMHSGGINTNLSIASYWRYLIPELGGEHLPGEVPTGKIHKIVSFDDLELELDNIITL